MCARPNQWFIFPYFARAHCICLDMGWLQLGGSLKSWVSLAEYSLFYRARLQKRPIINFYLDICICRDIGWRRFIGCLNVQVIFRKRATNYRALLREMTCKDKASYGSSPRCIQDYRVAICKNMHMYAYTMVKQIFIYMHTSKNKTHICIHDWFVAICLWKMLQCVAVCYSVLQCVVERFLTPTQGSRKGWK